jgi:outer membrane protein W
MHFELSYSTFSINLDLFKKDIFMLKKIGIILTVSTLISNAAFADDTGKWSVKLYGGISTMGDQSIEQTGVPGVTGATGTINSDNGFMAGGSVGYNYTNNLSVELAWDYRSNDSKTNFSDRTSFNDGNFASNIFFVNGKYTFDTIPQTNLRPYIGAGLGYVQEIDLDLVNGGVEYSYSKNNEMAYQFMTGITYTLTKKIDLDAGLRYVRVDSINLKRENGSGELRNVDYDPLSLAIGLSYKF